MTRSGARNPAPLPDLILPIRRSAEKPLLHSQCRDDSKLPIIACCYNIGARMMEATMKQTYWKEVLAILVLVAISAPVAWAEAGSRAADEAAIKKLVASFNECWNNKDVHTCAMLYTEDGDFTSVRGDADYGRPAVEKHYQKVFTTFLKNAHRTDTVRSVRFLSRKLACVDTDFEMTGAIAPNAAEATKAVRKGLLTWIVTKQDGQWRILVFHELDYPGK